MSRVRQFHESYCDDSMDYSASHCRYFTCSSAHRDEQHPNCPKAAKPCLNTDAHGNFVSRECPESILGFFDSDYVYPIADNIPNEESLPNAPNLPFSSADFEYPVPELTYESEVKSFFSPVMYHSLLLSNLDYGDFPIADGNPSQFIPDDEHFKSCSLTTSYKKLPNSSTLSGPSTRDRKYADSLESNFCGPARCPWKGCTSRAIFANPRALNNHLNNIHLKPLVCDAEGCGYQKPFRNKYDLERHRQTAHVRAHNHECPFSQCPNIGFARKDKLWVHIRDRHDTSSSACDVCPVIHCGKKVGTNVSEHMQKEHGSFECGLGACGKKQSRFTDLQLGDHLRSAHGVHSAEASRAVGAAKKLSDKTVRKGNLYTDTKVRDCITCRL